MRLATSLFFFLVFLNLEAQLVIRGKVTEATTGTPVPFATVQLVGTTVGSITSFDGEYVISAAMRTDSIEVRYVGFDRKVKAIGPGNNVTINFQLEENVTSLDEIVVYPEENPAFAILRQVVDHKNQNDKRQLPAFNYESYTKIEVDVNNVTDRFKNRKFVKKITSVLDSIQQLVGDDGRPILPVFLSEAISRLYIQNNPDYRRENIQRTKVSGVGITDGSLTSQVIGSSFQEYNFYQNWLNIVGKEFISPIADGWRSYYDYDLVDSLFIGDNYCYQLNFFPRRPQDLAFDGKMWITKDAYALRRIDATVKKTANLNFVEKIKIQQDLMPTAVGPWLPEKTRVVIDFGELTKQSAGLLAKFYVSNKDVVINEPKDPDFFLNPITMEENVRQNDLTFWADARHDSLTPTELNIFEMIDTLNQIPVVKNYVGILKFLGTGYAPLGILDIGPYTTFIGDNDVEGFRLGFGARTNINFSNRWILGGYFGYGFDDEDWKYQYRIQHIFNRQPWTTLTYEQQLEIEQIWLLNDDISPESLFYTFSRFGTLTQPFNIRKYQLKFNRQLLTGLNATLAVKHQKFRPLFDFNYFVDTGDTATASDYQVSEAQVSIRYARDELFVINDNQRISLGPNRYPAITVDYIYGAPDVLGSDFQYHKIQLTLEKRQKMGLFGVANFQVKGGQIIGDLPYTLLYNPIGNESPFYVGFAYNLMDFFEFSTDQYVELRYKHSFEGLILNRIPLMKRLKWRLIGSANMLVGGIRDENLARTTFETLPDGRPQFPFSLLDGGPYVEVGYGVENIFKFFSLQAFHRLTYLDNGANNFGIKFNAKIKL